MTLRPSSGTATDAAAAAIRTGRTTLGIELGSTRIKACLIDADDPAVVAYLDGNSLGRPVATVPRPVIEKMSSISLSDTAMQPAVQSRAFCAAP